MQRWRSDVRWCNWLCALKFTHRLPCDVHIQPTCTCAVFTHTQMAYLHTFCTNAYLNKQTHRLKHKHTHTHIHSDTLSGCSAIFLCTNDLTSQKISFPSNCLQGDMGGEGKCEWSESRHMLYSLNPCKRRLSVQPALMDDLCTYLMHCGALHQQGNRGGLLLIERTKKNKLALHPFPFLSIWSVCAIVKSVNNLRCENVKPASLYAESSVCVLRSVPAA